MGAPVVHFEIVGRDGEKLKHFYGTLFDWKINSDNPLNYGLVQAEAKGIGGGIGQTEPGDPGHATFFVEVDDVQATLDNAEEMGAKTRLPLTVIPGMVTFATFTDPEGHLIGLVKSENG